MPVWRQLTRGLRALIQRRAADDEVADEVESYLEQATAAHIARGLDPGRARRAARLEMGSATAVREQVRGYGWENAIEIAVRDAGYALRRLRRKPGFTAASLLTLALGIGASTAIFSVIYGVLLKPLPYPQPDRIVGLRHTAPGIHINDLNLAASLYYTYLEEGRVFQDVAMWTADTVTLTDARTPEEIPVLEVTHQFLPMLGSPPELGRPLSAHDDNPASERTVVLSHSYWSSHFGEDRTVLGRRIMLDGYAHEVIGVLPSGFEFMDLKFSMLVPLRMNRGSINLISFCCQGFARLKAGVTLAQANEDVARMLALAPSKFPLNPGVRSDIWAGARMAPRLQLLQDVAVGNVGNTLWVLMATVGLVLLIACANVANLLLVRADGRQHELAVRTALGAGWRRIAAELLLESLLLAIGGGVIGLSLAYGALRLLVVSDMTSLPRIHDISIDPMVLAFTITISVTVALLLGLVPILKYGRPSAVGLRSEGRTQTFSRERGRVGNKLVVTQVALALVLLVGSALMIRTFQALRHVEPGFSGASQVETFRISVPETQVHDEDAAIRMEQAIVRKVEAIGGVTRAALISTRPMELGFNDPVIAEGHRDQAGTIPAVRRFKFISPGYFAVSGARLLSGRDLTWTEVFNRTPVVLVSENLAREWWGDVHAAIGKRIRPRVSDDWREVIGVVADLRDDGVDRLAPAVIYWPLLQNRFEGAPSWAVRNVALVVRSSHAGRLSFRHELQHAVASISQNTPVADLKTLQSIYDRSLARTTLTLILLAVSGVMALLLSVIGLYGVLSYTVSQRRRDIGIRLALGAPVEGVNGMFVRQGLVLAGAGVICGIAGAVALTRLMKSLLYQVSPIDPPTYIGVSLGMILAAALASYLPARTASRIDPAITLRSE